MSQCLVLTPHSPHCPCLSLKSFLLFQHPPPTPVLHFFLDGRWGTSRERLTISKDQRAVRSVPGLPLLLAAERLLTGCHLSVDVVLGDVAVTQGRSYWACAVDPASYLVKVGVGLESKLQESFQGAPDVISPRSGFSGTDGVWEPWVEELGTVQGGKGSTDLQGWSWEEIRRKQQDNGSQVRGLWPGKTWAPWEGCEDRVLECVTRERDDRRGSHLHSIPPSLQASMFFLPDTPFPTSVPHLLYLLHTHLVSMP